MRVGIIGAGIAGLACAQSLVAAGHTVSLFDKGRGIGGRVATRRIDAHSFDHGAQYFTIRDDRFRAAIQPLIAAGHVALWPANIRVARKGNCQPTETPVDRYVGTPAMSSFAKALAEGLNVQLNATVQRAERRDQAWQLIAADQPVGEPFDRLVTTAPPIQSRVILGDYVPEITQHLATAQMMPCWTTMLAFAQRLPVNADAAFVHDSPLRWVARNSSKPGRSGECWVLHAADEWSRTNVERSPDEITHLLLDAFFAIFQMPPQPSLAAISHRWRFATPVNPLPQACLYDAASGVGACGDWCNGPRIEGAYLSGLAMAEAIIAS